jgi:hypothetical protein
MTVIKQPVKIFFFTGKYWLFLEIRRGRSTFRVLKGRNIGLIIVTLISAYIQNKYRSNSRIRDFNVTLM